MLALGRNAAASIVRCWARSGASDCVHSSKSWFQSTDTAWNRYAVQTRHLVTRGYSHVAAPPPAKQLQQWCSNGRFLRDLGSSPRLPSLWCLRTVQYSSSSEQAGSRVKQRNRNTALYMVAVVTGMIGFTYFSVPLYRIFCAATGYGGTVAEGKTVETKLKQRIENPDVPTEQAAANRMVTVNFVSEVQPGLKWSFTPCQKAIKVRPGQSTLVFYTAENTSDDHLTAVSTYNVAPPQVGRYFNKIQCFCFEEQHLRPRESVDMPVFFYIDPEFATDRRLKNVDHITLSYVFFKTGDVPTHADGTELTPGESMPAHLLPSQQALKSGMQATAEASEQEVVEKSAAPKSCTDLEKSKRKQAGTTGANESNDTAASAGEQKVA